MTCIVGLVDKKDVYIGGDSAGVAGYSLSIRTDEKVFQNGDFIFGFTDSFRMGNLLRYKFVPPTRPVDISDKEYIHIHFIDAVMDCLKDNCYATITNNEIIGGQFLLGYNGELYYIDRDFQVGMVSESYDSIGCGSDIAKGSLFSTDNTKMKPLERIEMALQAAERFSINVAEPFNILMLEG